MPNRIDRTVEVGTIVGIAILASESYSRFLPKVADIRAASPGDKKIAADVHAGELIAGVTILSVSSVASVISGTASPIVFGGVGFLAMFLSYEWLLRSNRPFENG